MKTVRIIIQQYSINKMAGKEFNLLLDKKANVIDTINEVDKIIASEGKFPLGRYCSLLHMIYNPIENRFYKQTAITTYTNPQQTFNVRDNPKKKLPERVTVVLIPEGGCISEWEEVLKVEKFLEAAGRGNL